jgi:hypothetical protein
MNLFKFRSRFFSGFIRLAIFAFAVSGNAQELYVGDPHYQRHALRFADALVRHYAKHPALLAFGIDNEPGDGPISYSATVKGRFIEWKAKYGSLENQGAAIYVGPPARQELLDPMVGELIERLAIKTGPRAPAGAMARQIDATHNLYLNIDGTVKRVELLGRSRSLLRDRDYEDSFELEPCEPEFVKTQ